MRPLTALPFSFLARSRRMLLPFLAASLSAVLPSYEVDCDRDLALKKYKQNIVAAGNPLADKYENAEKCGEENPPTLLPVSPPVRETFTVREVYITSV